MPSAERVTIFDVNSGFTNSTDALIARWHEDDRAMQVLGARQLRAPFIDSQYRVLEDYEPAHVALTAEVAALIEQTARDVGATRLFGPLGLAHPDHVIASDATVQAAGQVDIPTWLYEEIPTRVLQPELVPERFATVTASGWHLKLDFVGTGSLDTKRAAIEAYVSQQWALDQNLLYVPERVHRLT